jgi:DegV family protein with EDD domain
MVPSGCRVEVIDSTSVSMGVGLVALAAARVARMGTDLQTVLAEARDAIQDTHIFGVLDTLKYVFIGGRLGKAKALLGTLLNVKPLLTMRDGEIMPAGLARTRSKGLDRLYDIVKGALSIRELALVPSTDPAEAVSFRERLSTLLPKDIIRIARLGPALGAHGGPGTLLMAFRKEPNGAT